MIGAYLSEIEPFSMKRVEAGVRRLIERTRPDSAGDQQTHLFNLTGVRA